MKRKPWRRQLSEEAEAISVHATRLEQVTMATRAGIIGLGFSVLFVLLPTLVGFSIYKQTISPWFYLINPPLLWLFFRHGKTFVRWNWRFMRKSLCRTQWAKDEGYTPNDFTLFADGSDGNP